MARYARARAYKGSGVDPSFTLGKMYLALGVQLQPTGRPAMIVVQRDSDGTPSLVELQYFDVVDPVIPSDWCFFDFGNGHHCIEPKEFGGDFWDRYHDADPVAERTFDRVIEKLKAFHAHNPSSIAG